MRSIIMDVMLSRYLSKRDLRAAVILRTERNSIDWIMPEVSCLGRLLQVYLQ